MGYAFAEEIENVAVTKEKRDRTYNMPSGHYHDHYEIYYLKKGNVRYFINESVYDVNEGDVVLIPPHVIHKTASLLDKGAERILISFTNKFIVYPRNDKIFSCFDVSYFKNAQIGEIVEKAADEFFNRDCYSDEMIAGYIREIIVKLNRLSGEKIHHDVSWSNSVLQDAVHFICENYDKELTLSGIAKMFAMSESHFSRQFKVYTGFGVAEYISIVRIKNAEKLLVNTNLPVTEIAQNCGFNSSSYFAAVFKKMRGKTPVEIRKRRDEILQSES